MGLIKRFKSLFSSNVIGLDIGDNSIKIVEAETKKDKIILNNLAIGATPEGAVNGGKLEDVEMLAAKIKSLLKKNGFNSEEVVSAISGEQVIIRTVEIPKMPKDELAEIIKWEADEQIPIPVEEAILDFEILEEKADGSYEIMLIAVDKETINKYLDLFEKLDLEAKAIEIEPVAAIRSIGWLYPEQTIALMDMGAETTDISVFHNRKLIFTRSVGIAGENITEEIMESYEMDREEAEEYQKNNNLFGDANLSIITRNLTTAIYRSLDYFEVKHKDYDIDRLVLVGGGSKLIGFDTHLTNEFGIEAERLNLASNIEINVEGITNEYLSKIMPVLGVSIGLALREGEEDDKSIAS
jgi:type IV pilus assembly protein PilM